MKKFLKYICFFTVLFSLCFVDKFKAEDDYLFYCDYDLINAVWYDEVDYNLYTTFSLRAKVYKDGTAKFFHDDKELISGKFLSWDYDFDDWNDVKISFKVEDYYNEATKNGSNSCPVIRTYINEPGAMYDMALYFGSTDNLWTYEFANSAKGGVNKNPNLTNDEQEEIDKNTPTKTQQCKPIMIEPNVEKNLTSYLQIDYWMDSLGRKFAEITYNGKSGRIEEWNGEFASVDVNMGTGIINRFNIHSSDFSTIFNQNFAQLNNNTFTCPTKNPKIVFMYSSTGQVMEYLISYNDEVAKDYGNVDKAPEFQEGSVQEFIKNLSIKQSINKKRGKCTDYLGSASDPDSIASFLDDVYTLIKIGSILLVIVLTMLDLVNTVSGNKDNLTEVLTKGVKRLIILVIILLLPTLIDLIADAFGLEDILCGIK